ncbi:hypothetical protein FB451DRAFT_1362919 [Mycena latifolia]|nr:hypothetical protein FB451DRAFT_1362919 [Mycena latifolia]
MAVQLINFLSNLSDSLFNNLRLELGKSSLQSAGQHQELCKASALVEKDKLYTISLSAIDSILVETNQTLNCDADPTLVRIKGGVIAGHSHRQAVYHQRHGTVRHHLAEDDMISRKMTEKCRVRRPPQRARLGLKLARQETAPAAKHEFHQHGRDHRHCGAYILAYPLLAAPDSSGELWTRSESAGMRSLSQVRNIQCCLTPDLLLARNRPPMASHRPPRRQPSFVKRPREELAEIARETLAAVERGSYKTDFGDETHALQDLSTVPGSTEYFDADALAQWASHPPTRLRDGSRTALMLCHNSTLEGVRFCLRAPLPLDGTQATDAPRPAVLNFASATSPGGGVLFGARAQEESLARASNLYSALASPAAAPFYAAHDTERAPRYSHAMLLTRNVRLARDDAGTWVSPADVDVLSCAAVNARAVRVKLQREGQLARGAETPLPPAVQAELRAVMRERMARILHLLHREGAQDLVLGSFGTGAFGNEVGEVAGVWAELLAGEGAPFRDVFRRVVFAVIDHETYGRFREVFRREKVRFTEDGGW